MHTRRNSASAAAGVRSRSHHLRMQPASLSTLEPLELCCSYSLAHLLLDEQAAQRHRSHPASAGSTPTTGKLIPLTGGTPAAPRN